MRIARRVAKAQRDGLEAVGVNLKQNNGARAGQDVFHFHMHVIPRYEDDTVLTGCVWGVDPWKPPRNSTLDRREVARAIVSHLPNA